MARSFQFGKIFRLEYASPMNCSRRRLLQTSAAALTAAALPPSLAASPARRQRFSVSTYSYWHFHGEKYPIEQVIEQAASLGFDGVEVLHRQMTGESTAYLNNLKRAAFRNGLDLVMFTIHQDFVSPQPEERRKMIQHTLHCIELAAQLGIPAIRPNSGRWKTIPSFDELMKVKGNEPPVAGYTEDDALRWCIDSVRECLPAAEKAGVMLNMENHWGLTTKPDNLLRIYRAAQSPWFGITLDIGNFPDDPYAGIEQLAPHASIVHAKTYYGGGEWYTLDLDYKRIAGILQRARFAGYVSLEMEGKESAATAVPRSLEVLRAAFQA